MQTTGTALKTINTGKAEITLIGTGQIQIRVQENAEIFVDDIKAINEAKNEIVKDDPHTVLVVSPNSGHISPDAREFSASMSSNSKAIARAIVARSLLSR